MAVFVVNGVVPTSWAGNNNGILIGVGTGAGVKHREASLSIDAGSNDTTAFSAAAAFTSSITGLRGSSVQFSGRWEPANNSNSIAITYTNGYIANLRRLTMNISYAVQESTVSDGSGVVARSYLPGLYTVRGQYECFVDDTTAIVLPGSSTSGSATFKFIENSSDDHTAAGTIRSTVANIGMAVGNIPTITYDYEFESAVTFAGETDGSTGTYHSSPFKYWIDSASGVLGTSATGSLVLTAATGRTYTANAFPAAINIEAVVGQPLGITVNAQISGNVTVG
jgi:hypothetical protein